jgi:hypothetical protein
MANGILALFLVDSKAAGVTARGYGTQDGGRAAEVMLKDAPTTLITLDGATALAHAVDIGIASTCAEAIGVMEEYIVSHYFKKLTRLEMRFGDTLHHLSAVSSRMQDTAGVFA